MSTNLGSTSGKRTAYFDYLRVLATVAVMLLHIAAQNWSVSNVNGYGWNVFNFFDSIVRWGVPVFVMISGALFLEHDIPLENILKKNVFRLITAFVAWASFYALTTKVFLHKSWTTFAADLVRGHYHMWFLPMIIGLYLCVPILRRIILDQAVMKYYLFLAFFFAFFFPQVISVLSVPPPRTLFPGL